MIKLITDSDLDGLSCAIIMNQFYEHDFINTTVSRPGLVNSYIEEFINSKEYDKYERIYITDLSITKESAQKIQSIQSSCGYKFIIIDHHKTSEYIIPMSIYFDNNETKTWSFIDTEYKGRLTCGAELLMIYMFKKFPNKERSLFHLMDYIELVRLWDTWGWKTGNSVNSVYSKYLDMYRRLLPAIKFINDISYRIKFRKDIISYQELGMLKLIELKNTNYVEKRAENIKKVKLHGYNIAVCFAEDNISELGETVCRNNPDIDFCAIVNPSIRVVSLRTIKDDIDLSEFAKRYGGGGHKKAAGYVYNEQINDSIVCNIISNGSNEEVVLIG